MDLVRRLRLPVVLAAVLLSVAQSATALTDEEIYRRFQFNAVPIGARAMGMGGSFVAVADDASAVAVNPAGLSSLLVPGIYLELGSSRSEADARRSSQGSLDVNPVTGARDLPYLSLSADGFSGTETFPALLGYSYPMEFPRVVRRLVLGASRQVGYSEERSLPSSGRGSEARFAFDTFPNVVSGNTVEAYSIPAPTTGSLSGESVSYNAFAAAEIHPDFSVGITLTLSTLDMQAETLTRVDDPLQILAGSSHPRLPVQPNLDIYRTEMDGSDTSGSWAVGIMWHPQSAIARSSSSRWRFGTSFRKGERFGIEERTTLNGSPDRVFENTFSVPDVYALGASYTVKGRWALSGQLERVTYSDLLLDFEGGVNYVTGPHLAAGAFSTRSPSTLRYNIDDGTVYRLGGEYVLPARFGLGGTLTVRGGFLRTPDMQIRMKSFNSTDVDVNDTYKAAFPEGDAVNHLTVGAGLEWARMGVQAAFQTSELGDRLAVSFTYALGRP